MHSAQQKKRERNSAKKNDNINHNNKRERERATGRSIKATEKGLRAEFLRGEKWGKRTLQEVKK